MMAKLIESVPGFLAEVLRIRSEWPSEDDTDPELWYRGINDSELSLLPGAYWRSTCDEDSLFLSFRSQVPSYISRQPVDDWDWYFLAQHYRLPTRLLDWTESPLVALYFALENPQESSTPCVWAMDPGAFNKVTHGWDSAYVIVPPGPGTCYWLPNVCGRGKESTDITSDDFKDNTMPIAIYPRRSNPRIVSQRGVFTIHGTEVVGIEKVFADKAHPDPARIERVLIDTSKREDLQAELRAAGINEVSLFPEAESVSRDLKRLYKVQE